MNKRTKVLLGQESWELKSAKVKAAVTRRGGHLAPVYFRVGERWIHTVPN